MTQQSSFQLEPSDRARPAVPTAGTPRPDLPTSAVPAFDVPLSERPLVADDQQTVVRSSHAESAQGETATHSDAGQDILDRLFPNTGYDSQPERGLRLAHFEVRERIASGGMGAVFLATDLELSREVALKILHPSTSRDPSLVARFRNEARACARLNHDNVARVYFTGQQDGVYFIAYEYANGRTIKDLIQQRGTLSSSETVNYAIQTTLALNHIFAAGIVHRDIKPSNIILTECGRVKVVDLGLARRESQDSIGEITVAGTTLGTFDYISPEQARDPRTADIRSDIYSLGCTMYHMLTGQPPYPEGTALQKLLDHQGKTPPDAAKFNRSIEPALAATVQKMMSTNPAARYQEPGQLLADLMDLAAHMGLRSVPAEGIVWQRIQRPSIRQVSGAVFLFASVAMICAAALTIHFMPRQRVVFQEVPQAALSRPPSLAGTGDTGGTVADSTGLQMTGDQGNARSAAGSEPTATDDLEDEVNTVKSLASGNSTMPAGGTPETEGDATRWQPPDEFGGDLTSGSDINGDRPPVPAETVSRPFRLASIVNGRAGDYDSLRQAMAEASDGDTILLRFNGVQRVPPAGLDRIMGQILTLKADEGFHPVLEFQAPPTTDARSGVFRLINKSQLTIEGVELKLPQDSSPNGGQRVVFDCSGPNRVVLRDVAIDIATSRLPRTAIFRMNESDRSHGGIDHASFVLSRVIARGTADLLYVESQSDLEVQISDCGFGLDGSLLNSVGSASMNLGQGELSLNLTHVTCLLTQPLIYMHDSDTITGGGPQRRLPAVTVTSGGCVFASVSGGGVLVQSRGNSSVDRLEELLTWTGSTNLYHGIEWFWNVEGTEPDLTSMTYNFDRWQSRWPQEPADGSEASTQFVWNEAWWSHHDGHINLSEMTADWLTLTEKLFHAPTKTRPRFKSYEIPGVAPEQLPQFRGDSRSLPETPSASGTATRRNAPAAR